MSKIDEMSVQYADKQLEMADPELYATSYSRHTKMGIRVFCGSDIEEAYTDGAKAVLEEIEDVLHEFNEDDPIFCHYINIVDKINELKQQ